MFLNNMEEDKTYTLTSRGMKSILSLALKAPAIDRTAQINPHSAKNMSAIAVYYNLSGVNN